MIIYDGSSPDVEFNSSQRPITYSKGMFITSK